VNLIQTEESPYKVTLEVFEGPLDFLLNLIRQSEIDIYDIPIAQITEQYLQYLSLMEALDLEIAGEWLVMAATLLEIKSRMLLPKDPVRSDDDEEPFDPRLELVERLIEYEKFKSAAEMFREREEERAKVFMRGPAEVEFDLKPLFSLEDITAGDLLSALQRVLADVGDGDVTTLQRRKVTVRMRMREIWHKLTDRAGRATFEDLFDEDVTRVDVVITFVALLELLKMRRVKVRQRAAFGPMDIIPILEKESDAIGNESA
jgi:segregation and condensation protein A